MSSSNPHPAQHFSALSNTDRFQLRVIPHYDNATKLDGLTMFIGPEYLDSFSQLLDRALNCYPEAAPEWKHLSDMIKHGRMLQDYYDEAKFHKSRPRTSVPTEQDSGNQNKE